MTFEEARDQVREDYREARAIEIAQSLVNDMYSEAHRPWSASPRDPNGFSESPAGEPISFEALKQRFSTTHEVTYGQTGLMDTEQLKNIPGLGSAGLRMGQQMVLLPELALRVKGILEKDPGDSKPVLNVLEPAVVLTYVRDPKTRAQSPHQAYLFRVMDARPSAPPEALGIKREEVIGDWKLLQAHELAHQRAEALANRARVVGLASAVEEDTALKQIMTDADQATSRPVATLPPSPTQYAKDLQPFTPQRLTRSTTFLEQPVGFVTDIPRAIFDLADAPVDEAAPHRVACLPQAKEFHWLVTELVEIKPLYAGAFEKQLAATVQNERRREQEVRTFARMWGSADNVTQRTDFTPEGPGPSAPRGAPAAP
jgi:hypothetical protein